MARSYSGSSTLNAVCTFCYTSTLGACVQSYPALCDPVTVARQAPLSMGLSRQEYWSGLPFPPPRDLPDPGIKPTSPVSPALHTGSLPLSHQESNIKIGTKEKFHQGEMVTKRESVSMLRKMRKFHRISNLKKIFKLCVVFFSPLLLLK